MAVLFFPCPTIKFESGFYILTTTHCILTLLCALQYVDEVFHKKNHQCFIIDGFAFCRDDKIRTCDPTPPRRVRYRAAPHPDLIKMHAMFSAYYLLIHQRL